MKKKLQKLNKFHQYAIMILVVLLGIGIGGLGREALVITNVIKPKAVEVVVRRDSMPLENGGEVIIELVGDKKAVYISYEDFEYISKKVKVKKLIKSLNGLFARMEE